MKELVAAKLSPSDIAEVTFLGLLSLCFWAFVIYKLYREIIRAPDHHGNSDDHVTITIPDVVFSSQDFKDGGGVECIVCLAEFADGDKAKCLPRCNHFFHAECIDSWIRSHSTCPICRISLGSIPELGNSDESLNQNPDIPTS